MANYDTTSYNGNTLSITSITPSKIQKTRKTLVGKTLIETSIIGSNSQQWELQVSGVIVGTRTVIGTNRAILEALDSGAAYAFVDGIHNGNYIIRSGSLSFEDVSDDAGTYYKYSLVLVEN